MPGVHIPRRKRKTAKGKSVSCAIHTGLDYSVVNMGSAIFFPPNTHQQQTTTLRNILQCISPIPPSMRRTSHCFFFESQAVSGYLCQLASLGCELELNADIFMNATYLEGPSECWSHCRGNYHRARRMLVDAVITNCQRPQICLPVPLICKSHGSMRWGDVRLKRR